MIRWVTQLLGMYVAYSVVDIFFVLTCISLHSGLYDPRMGPTSQQSLPCVTCDLPYINCPGHPGHIELDFPVRS